MGLREIKLDRRDKFSLLFSILAFALVLATNILLDSWLLMFLVDLAITGAFIRLMVFRKKMLDNPYRHWKCNWGSHDLDYERRDWMRGTGKYVGDQEIMEKRDVTVCKCKRIFCPYKEERYW